MTTIKIRYSGAGDSWRIHECVYEDERLTMITDWETEFCSSEEAVREARAHAAHRMEQGPHGVAYVFDGEMPRDVQYDRYWGTPREQVSRAVEERDHDR